MIKIFTSFRYFYAAAGFSAIVCAVGCNDQTAPVSKTDKKEDSTVVVKEEEEKPLTVITKPGISYSLVARKVWLKENDSLLNDSSKKILYDLNRVDASGFRRLDSIIVPSNFSFNSNDYLPFPYTIEEIRDVDRMIFFSYPTQTFAAYDHGELTRSGPTNMGRKNKPTPTGLFFTNWKGKEVISTVNDEWKLKWNFNVSNHGGVGFHQYALPGYPASHSCLRLQANDAEFLYTWANQWILKSGIQQANGTPVIIFGEYPFGSPRPWHALAKDSVALEISEKQLAEIIAPYKDSIMNAQLIRSNYIAAQAPKDSM